MKKLKEFFQEKIILSAVMCVLLAVVLVTATYGWYALNRTPKMYGLELSTGGVGGFKVAIEPGGPDIMSGEYYNKYYNRFGKTTQFTDKDGNLIAMIPINLGEFENIESKRIAPGAYGPLPFYITSYSASIKSYQIKVQFEYKPHTDESADTLTPEEQEKLQEKVDYVESMIMDHFSIYQKMYTDDEGIVRFSDPLTFYLDETDEDVISASGNLRLNVEEPVMLYWVWNYELTDIPEYWHLKRFQDAYGDDLGVDKDGKAINEIVTRKAVRQYDEEDTELGNYLDDIKFNIYIEGNPGTVRTAEPATQSGEDAKAGSEAASVTQSEEDAETENEAAPVTESEEDSEVERAEEPVV